MQKTEKIEVFRISELSQSRKDLNFQAFDGR